jgi:hypothetical protein
VNDKVAAFVLYPGLTPPDLIGPLQVMTGLETAEVMFGIQPRHNVRVVAESLDIARTTGGQRPGTREYRTESPVTSGRERRTLLRPDRAIGRVARGYQETLRTVDSLDCGRGARGQSVYLCSAALGADVRFRDERH